MAKIRVVHYINQFFANIGGEEKADIKPELREGVVGPGVAFNQAFGDEAEIVATVICGDSYFNENLEEAKKTVIESLCQTPLLPKVPGQIYWSCFQRWPLWRRLRHHR